MAKSPMLIPKNKRRVRPLVTEALRAPLSPPERRAMREIATTADIFTINGKTFVLAEVRSKTLDALAVFEAELSEMEDSDHFDDTSDFEVEHDNEPDYRHPTFADFRIDRVE